MTIDPVYDASKSEGTWYNQWMQEGLFHSKPDDRNPYTVVIPPPNVTGVLHMGHMLNNTIQDVLVRRARMKGLNACWVPGTDHASIATEAKVVEHLRKKGIDKHDLTREEFLAHAWEWKEKHGGIILKQLQKLGASCDWERTRFTMEDELSESVLDVFIDLYNKGFIYRGIRMINWDPKALTALSEEEVNYREVNSKLFYIRYPMVGQPDQGVTVATTRPETILGDVAICVNPKDDRYKGMIGKTVTVPLIGRAIPVITDDHVDPEFGTGALKITPAHDVNDYEIGRKYNLETIDILDDHGRMSEAASLYVGMDRFEVRKAIEKDLSEKGLLVKTEDYVNKVGFSERTNVVIEPKISVQWFCDMSKMAKPALKHVMDDHIQFHPAKMKNTYRHWMENIKDWCISRQLWWGQRIPAWYCGNSACHSVVIVQKEKPDACPRCGNSQKIHQDEDVLDTWFSSWLWPIGVFNGIKNPDNQDINYYYPTNDLVTAPEIMFFWVARMIMAGYEYRGEAPFRNVYFTGIVRDKLRRKMSKSLGNSPDPVELMEKYGADGVRVGMLLCSPAGNDLLFDEGLCEQGRNFCNKLWNSFRLINGWETKDSSQPEYAAIACNWFDAMLNHSIREINQSFGRFRISEALMCAYKLVWDHYCSWFLEIIKPPFGEPIDKTTLATCKHFLDKILRLLHPFIPFVTEEIWQRAEKRKPGQYIMVQRLPEACGDDADLRRSFEITTEVVTAIRKFRKDKKIGMKTPLQLFVEDAGEGYNKHHDGVIAKLCGLDQISYEKPTARKVHRFVIKANKYAIPMPEGMDDSEEKKHLLDELAYTRSFLEKVTAKLANKNFVEHAPEKVVAMERKKMADARERIKALESQLGMHD